MITKVAYQIHMYRGRPMISLRKKNSSENFANLEIRLRYLNNGYVQYVPAKRTVKKRNIWL